MKSSGLAVGMGGGVGDRNIISPPRVKFWRRDLPVTIVGLLGIYLVFNFNYTEIKI